MRSFDDLADIHGKHAKAMRELRALAEPKAEFQRVQLSANPSQPIPNHEIPDVAGAPKGLGGIKAPFGYKQDGDIRDRLQASGRIPFGMK